MLFAFPVRIAVLAVVCSMTLAATALNGATDSNVGAEQGGQSGLLNRLKKAAEDVIKNLPTPPPTGESTRKDPSPPPSLGGNVTETPLQTLEGVSLSLTSPDGSRIATSAMKGSRSAMFLDGQAGPPFDEVLSPQFSPDGSRFAYIGRRGAQRIAMVDGKEGAVMSDAESLDTAFLTASMKVQESDRFHFSANGAHLAYRAADASGAYLVVDGVKKGPYRAIDSRMIAVTNAHVIYAAQEMSGNWSVIVDGQAGKPRREVGSLAMSPNGAHYAYLADRTTIVVDGRDAATAIDPTDLTVSNSGRFAFIDSDKASDAKVLVLDGQRAGLWPVSVSASLEAYEGRPVVFALEGSRVAWVQRARSGAVSVVIDGKAGPEYSKIELLRFSDDGRRVAYVASMSGRRFAVVDGEELPFYGSNISEFQFSPSGKRYAYVAGDNTAGTSIVIDGTPAKIRDYTKSSLSFSKADRVAYGWCQQFGTCELVVDDVRIPVSTLQPHTVGTSQIESRLGAKGSGGRLPFILWSADGTTAAASARVMAKGEAQVHEELIVVPQSGAPTRHRGTIMSPVLSPSGGHVAGTLWIRKPGSSANQHAIMIDGKAGPELDLVFGDAATAIRFENDTTVSVFGARDGQLVKLRVSTGGR